MNPDTAGRTVSRSLYGPLVLLFFSALPSPPFLLAQVSPEEIDEVLAASVLFLVDEEFDGDASNLKLGAARVASGLFEPHTDSVALAESVSANTGIPLHDRSLGRYCDRSSSWPRWKWNDPGVVVSARLIALDESEVETTVMYGNHGRVLRVHREDGTWLARFKDDSHIHIQRDLCRPPPPSGFDRTEQVAALEAAIMHVLGELRDERVRPLCLSGLDGWLEDVRQALEAAITGRGLTLACPEAPASWIYIGVHHVVFFETPDRVDIQLHSSSAEAEARLLEHLQTEGTLPALPRVRHCELRREAARWSVAECRFVPMSRRYPGPERRDGLEAGNARGHDA